MKLKKFKEKDKKKIGILLFTIVCILLVMGVILYKTFAIFETNDHLDLIKGSVEERGDIEFAFYINGNISKTVPKKEEGYSLDTSASYCKDVLTGNQISNINWNDEKWGIELNNINTTKTKCYLYFKEIYQEKILNGAIPDLGNGRLIPITIDKNGKVHKADITKEWYKYAEQRWANAIILRDGKSDDYSLEEEILENDIESYFVWIPRYKYQLKNSEEEFNKYTDAKNLGEIKDMSDIYSKEGVINKGLTEIFNIQFETKNKGNTQGGKEGDYMTHPAFLSFDSNGFWVGKFETGYNQNSDYTNVTPTSNWNFKGAEVNEENSAKIIIKPNVYSWRGIDVSHAFYTSYNYQRDLESHMMKNMEWGAIAYLTQSKYGRCIDNKCTEVRINNNDQYITGSSAIKEPTCGYIAANEICNEYGSTIDIVKSYDNPDSVASSTTNNYYGIYDLAGGSHE